MDMQPPPPFPRPPKYRYLYNGHVQLFCISEQLHRVHSLPITPFRESFRFMNILFLVKLDKSMMIFPLLDCRHFFSSWSGWRRWSFVIPSKPLS